MGKSAFLFLLIFFFLFFIFAFEIKANNIQHFFKNEKLQWVFKAKSFFQKDSYKVKANNIQYFFYKNEKLQWIFKAEKFFQKNSYEFFAEKVCITNPLEEFSIEGKKAMYNMLKDKFIIKGNVKLVTKDKGVLFTPKLIFFPNKQLIIGKDEVVLKRENIVIHGRGFFYDVKKGKFTITSQTRVEILN